MAPLHEVPDADVLAELGVIVIDHDEPWVTSVQAVAEDGLIAEMTWDQIAAAVEVKVTRGDAVIVRFERESISSVRVLGSDVGLHFEAELLTKDLQGSVTVEIGSTVTVRDALLRH